MFAKHIGKFLRCFDRIREKEIAIIVYLKIFKLCKIYAIVIMKEL